MALSPFAACRSKHSSSTAFQVRAPLPFLSAYVRCAQLMFSVPEPIKKTKAEMVRESRHTFSSAHEAMQLLQRSLASHVAPKPSVNPDNKRREPPTTVAAAAAGSGTVGAEVLTPSTSSTRSPQQQTALQAQLQAKPQTQAETKDAQCSSSALMTQHPVLPLSYSKIRLSHVPSSSSIDAHAARTRSTDPLSARQPSVASEQNSVPGSARTLSYSHTHVESTSSLPRNSSRDSIQHTHAHGHMHMHPRKGRARSVHSTALRKTLRHAHGRVSTGSIPRPPPTPQVSFHEEDLFARIIRIREQLRVKGVCCSALSTVKPHRIW
jgi:hypothetical protein